jgi:hypothetical protein
MSGTLAMGWQVPGPRSSVNCVNLKLNNSGLASGSMPGRCSSRVRVTGNFTPLPKVASSVSFFSGSQADLLRQETGTPSRSDDRAPNGNKCGLCVVARFFRGVDLSRPDRESSGLKTRATANPARQRILGKTRGRRQKKVGHFFSKCRRFVMSTPHS